MNTELCKEDYNTIMEMVRDIQDFPKDGIVFKDITPLLGSHEKLDILMTHITQRYEKYKLDYIAGIDARGFIFGSILADRLGIGFVPIRKKGKLPYTTLSQEYTLEYGFDELEIHTDAFGVNSRVLLIDDLLATGGTAKAASELISKVGSECIECCFIAELKFLNGKHKLNNIPVYSVLKF